MIEMDAQDDTDNAQLEEKVLSSAVSLISWKKRS